MYIAATATPNEETKRTQDIPQASRSARINSAPSLFNSSQVASDSTAYRSGEKKAQRRKTERGLSPCRGLSRDGSAKTTTPPRWAATSARHHRPWGPCPSHVALGRRGRDLRASTLAAGVVTSTRHLWTRPVTPQPSPPHRHGEVPN